MALRLDDELHRLGESAEIEQWPLLHAAGWWVASELVRRHPGEFKVYLTGGHFQYDVLAVSRPQAGEVEPGRSTAVVWMNRIPGGHFSTGSWFDDSKSTGRFNWLEVLLAPNRMSYVIHQLEQEAGLVSPKRSPPTTSQSIAARVIAGFLARTVFTRSKWLALNGMWDNGIGEAAPRSQLFEALPGMAELVPRSVDGFFDDDCFRYWFLKPADPETTTPWADMTGAPLVGFDTHLGRCWDHTGRETDLMGRYSELGRSIDALVSDICPPAF